MASNSFRFKPAQVACNAPTRACTRPLQKKINGKCPPSRVANRQRATHGCISLLVCPAGAIMELCDTQGNEVLVSSSRAGSLRLSQEVRCEDSHEDQ